MTPNQADKIITEYRRHLVRLNFVNSGIEAGDADQLIDTLAVLKSQMQSVAKNYPGRRSQIEKLLLSQPNRPTASETVPKE